MPRDVYVQPLFLSFVFLSIPFNAWLRLTRVISLRIKEKKILNSSSI